MSRIWDDISWCWRSRHLCSSKQMFVKIIRRHKLLPYIVLLRRSVIFLIKFMRIMDVFVVEFSRVTREGPGGHGPHPGKNRMVGNGRPITGCLVHIESQSTVDIRMPVSFPVLQATVSQKSHHSNGIKLGILYFCHCLQHKSWCKTTIRCSSAITRPKSTL